MNDSIIAEVNQSFAEAINRYYVGKTAAQKYFDGLKCLSPEHPIMIIKDPDAYKVAITDFLQDIARDGHLRVYDPVTTSRLVDSSRHNEDHDEMSDQRERFLSVESNNKFNRITISSFPFGES